MNPITLHCFRSVFTVSTGKKLNLGNTSLCFKKEKTNPFMKTKSSGRVSMVVTSNVSRFEGITMAPPDPILGVSEAFNAYNHELKLNLGVEAYRTEELQPYVLDVVKKVATVQGLSGTGSLKLAAALIERYFPGEKVLIPSPTWSNHKNIFNDAKVP